MKRLTKTNRKRLIKIVERIANQLPGIQQDLNYIHILAKGAKLYRGIENR